MKTWGQLSDEEREDLLKDYKEMTGKDACAKHGVEYNASKNSMSRAYRKAGYGGAREGSGMKKGTTLCSLCRKSLKNCKCFE